MTDLERVQNGETLFHWRGEQRTKEMSIAAVALNPKEAKYVPKEHQTYEMIDSFFRNGKDLIWSKETFREDLMDQNIWNLIVFKDPMRYGSVPEKYRTFYVDVLVSLSKNFRFQKQYMNPLHVELFDLNVPVPVIHKLIDVPIEDQEKAIKATIKIYSK